MLRLLSNSVVIVVAFALSTSAHARGSKPLSAQDQQALQETQEMMKDRTQIEEYKKANPMARQADDGVQALMGPDTDETYSLASDILADLVKEANGDPVKLNQLVEQAKRNPEAFAKKLSPTQRAKLKELSNGVEKRQGSASPH